MSNDLAEFIGPDFIGQLAEKQLHAGLELDFKALAANKKAWADDRAKLEQQADTIAQQAHDLESLLGKLRAIGQQAANAAGAGTLGLRSA